MARFEREAQVLASLNVHDRDGILSRRLDRELKGFAVRVLKTPMRPPPGERFFERLVGTIRRECLDFLISISEPHLRIVIREFAKHYNRGRACSSLGPGIPEPAQDSIPAGVRRHLLPRWLRCQIGASFSVDRRCTKRTRIREKVTFTLRRILVPSIEKERLDSRGPAILQDRAVLGDDKLT
jgi:hypothetical protein